MTIRNWEVSVYALYLLGGSSRFVHTEDIAVECHKILPESFSWTKYPDYPDKDIVRVALTDARKEKVGQLVTGRAGRGKGQASTEGALRKHDGWQLTQPGSIWISQNERRLAAELGCHEPKAHRQRRLQKLNQVRDHRLFQEFTEMKDAFAPSIGLLADLFSCRADADYTVWDKRFAALRNEAQSADQQDVLRFVDACESFVRSPKD